MRQPRTWIVGVVVIGVVFLTWLNPPLSLDALNCGDPSLENDAIYSTLQVENARLSIRLERAENDSRAADLERPGAAAMPRSPYATPDAFAYAFYATSDEYACGVLVNIYRLREVLRSRLPVHVLVSPEVSAASVVALRERGAVVHVEDPPRLKDTTQPQYQGGLLKLLSFKLHLLRPGLRRVLVLDADQLVMKNLDYLFTGLPAVDLAAPRAYWLGDRSFSTALMMINLSDRLWKVVKTGMDQIQPGQHDMDLMNDLLGHAALLLPGDFVTLNSHWADWNLPGWYHVGESNPRLSDEMVEDAQNPPQQERLLHVQQKRQAGAEPPQLEPASLLETSIPNEMSPPSEVLVPVEGPAAKNMAVAGGGSTAVDLTPQADAAAANLPAAPPELSAISEDSSSLAVAIPQQVIEQQASPPVEAVLVEGAAAPAQAIDLAEHVMLAAVTSSINGVEHVAALDTDQPLMLDQSSSPASSAEQSGNQVPVDTLANLESTGNTLSETPTGDQTVEAPAKAPDPAAIATVATLPASPVSKDHPLHIELYKLLDASTVIHFSAVGMPWSLTPALLKRERPNAHPALFTQFESWDVIARYVCPALS